jgi:hypothetical protein
MLMILILGLREIVFFMAPNFGETSPSVKHGESRERLADIFPKLTRTECFAGLGILALPFAWSLLAGRIRVESSIEHPVKSALALIAIGAILFPLVKTQVEAQRQNSWSEIMMRALALFATYWISARMIA